MRRTERLAKRPVDPAVQKIVRIWQALDPFAITGSSSPQSDGFQRWLAAR